MGEAERRTRRLARQAMPADLRAECEAERRAAAVEALVQSGQPECCGIRLTANHPYADAAHRPERGILRQLRGDLANASHTAQHLAIDPRIAL